MLLLIQPCLPPLRTHRYEVRLRRARNSEKGVSRFCVRKGLNSFYSGCSERIGRDEWKNHIDGVSCIDTAGPSQMTPETPSHRKLYECSIAL